MYSGSYMFAEAAYLHDDGSMPEDAQLINNTLLPPEFKPHFVKPNPWHQELSVESDFILIAEFSEMEGPKPLITIPSHLLKEASHYDLNAFVLKIMSVDHQHVGNEKFTMPEDSQVVLSEVKDGVHAYVHHFTLHDSQARGFVRPFCMAYVTADPKKLMTFYEEMMSYFGRVSWNFRYGNLKLFSTDLKHYKQDLIYTKECLVNGNNGIDSTDSQLNNILIEITGILDVVQPHLDDRHLDKKFHAMEEKHRVKETPCEQSINPSASCNDMKSLAKNNKNLVQREDSCVSLANYLDVSNLTMEDEDDYKPKVVKVNQRQFDKSLRSIHELCLWGAKEGLTRLRSILKYFSRDTATLQIEQRYSDLLDPSSCLLTIGHCVTINFLHNIDTQFLGTQWSVNQLDCHKSTHHLLKRWLSSDTMESFKSAESFFSLCEDGSFEPAYVLGGLEGSASSYEMISTPSDDGETFHDASSSFENGQGDQHRPVHLSSTDIQKEELTAHERSREDKRDSSSGEEGPIQSSTYSTPSSESPRKVKVPVNCVADLVYKINENTVGNGISSFIRTHSFSSHLIGSILSGRSVIVTGRIECEVRSTILSLRLFLPGHSGYQQASVYSQNPRPLKITDLVRLKLIGLVKPINRSGDHLIPDSIKRYVAILDLDKKSLFTLEYTGVAVKNIVNKMKYYPCESSYISYIQSILLELASKSFIYYHGYLVNTSMPESQESIYSLSHTYESIRQHGLPPMKLFEKLDVHSGDIPIVQYFAEVIKLQQAREYYSTLGLGDQPVHPVRISHEQGCLFKD